MSDEAKTPNSIADLVPGMAVAGTVKRIELYGAFVDIGVGRDGLLHISQLGKPNVRNVADVVQEGQTLTVYVLKVEKESGRIQLSLGAPPSTGWETLHVGDTVITDIHPVTLQDIEDFAHLSGDKFYAHMDANSLEGTIFTGRVAHGYFILSRAAGLFVDPPKGPVLLNYGLDECRFVKPVYPGMRRMV